MVPGEKFCMSVLSRLIHLLVTIAFVAVLGTPGGLASGSRCLKLASVEICMDPALRAGSEASNDSVGKKCFEAILLADLRFGSEAGQAMVWAQQPRIKPLSAPLPPWKPPRRAA